MATLGAMGVRVFNQKRDFAGAPVTIDAMTRFVRHSKVVVALVTPSFFDSAPCRAEVETAWKAGIPVVPTHSGMDHGARQILQLIDLADDPVKGQAVKACFRRGENLMDVHNPAHIEQVTADLRTKIVDRFDFPCRHN